MPTRPSPLAQDAEEFAGDARGTPARFGPQSLTATFDYSGSAESEERSSDSAWPLSTDEAPTPLRHERFQIGPKLGEGGMGVVYRARDTRDGREVALKLMKTALSGTARHRFEREFRSLSGLRHPHCLGVYDYGDLGGGPFFTMELFLGRPITSIAGEGLQVVLEPLLQLTHALDFIHGHGIVHRDVKPSNILVRPAARDDGTDCYETRLMDFGLAKYYGVKSSLSAEAGFIGTVAYCAPEQLNLDELDHRADLYCLGLVAYEVLSGRYAFPEARLGGMRTLMQAQLNDKPRPLADVKPDVPAPIADAVMKYLRKHARRRPDSAAPLRSAIAAYLGIAEPTAISGVALPAMRPGLSVTGFVCRASEQALLADVLDACLGSTPGSGNAPASLIVVAGEPGIGKSSVVQEAERLARGHGCQVYEGRCFDGNLSPFQPFVEIIRQLVAELKLQERREASAGEEDLTGTHVAGLHVRSLVSLLGIIDDYRGEILRIAPELRRYLPGEAYQQADQLREADYIYRALAAFFLEIAAFQPVCLSFEDLQWADKSSLDLLRHLAAALANARRSHDGSAGVPRLAIVASARTGYSSLEAMLAQLREQHHVLEMHLAALTEGETRELIALRLNCQPEELADELVGRVHRLCGGNPFFITETVRDWHDKQAITRSEAGWILATQVGDTTDLPETVRDVMRLRLQGLPPRAQQVLGAAAVIGAVVDIDLLRDALPELTEADVLDAVDVLLPRRVFRETGNPGHVEFVHDLLHELPYADLSAVRRRSLHRRVGELLEQRRGQGRAVAAAILADHFREADDRPKAFAYAMEAADSALEAYAFNNAIALLDTARELRPDDAHATDRYRLLDRLGTAYTFAGRPDDAIDAHEQALHHAGNRIERASSWKGIGIARERKGESRPALEAYCMALREIGQPAPRTVIANLIVGTGAAIEFHLIPAWWPVRYFAVDRAERDELAYTIYYRLTWVYVVRNIFFYSVSCYLTAAAAKRIGKPDYLAVAYSKFALNYSIFSFAVLGRHYLSLARKAVQQLNREESHARVEAHSGMLAYFGGRLDEAELAVRRSLPQLDKVRDTIATFSHHFLRHIHTLKGRYAGEIEESEYEIELGRARGHVETLAWGYYGKAGALARSGRVDQALELTSRAIELLRNDESFTIAVALGVDGFVRLQASDYTGALTSFEESRSKMIRSLMVYDFGIPAFAGVVESRLGPHWWTRERGPDRSVANRAARESRVARFAAWRFPNYRASALRVSGRAAAALGKTKQAIRYFERAIAAAEALGARYELARAYLDVSRVAPDNAEDYIRRGQQLLDELGAVVPAAERLPSVSE